jgi:Ethanolamine ammonia-lyase heavy chain (EC 4.3.1.7)
MASFVHTVGHLVYRFDSLKEVMAKASPARSGDFLAGVAAATTASGSLRRWPWPTSR